MAPTTPPCRAPLRHNPQGWRVPIGAGGPDARLVEAGREGVPLLVDGGDEHQDREKPATLRDTHGAPGSVGDRADGREDRIWPDVPSDENRSHGSTLGAKLRRLCNGARFRYVFD